MEENVRALAAAVRERRQELKLSQPDLADRARKIDVEHFGSTFKSPGLSVKTVSAIENADRRNLSPHTLKMLDAALEWPAGTSRAHLFNEPLPDGGPMVPSEVVRPAWVERPSQRVEQAQMREEVATLRREVAEMAEMLAGILHRLNGDGPVNRRDQ